MTDKANFADIAGAGDGTRTRNLLITNQLLCQLSYASDSWAYTQRLFPLQVKNAIFPKYFFYIFLYAWQNLFNPA